MGLFVNSLRNEVHVPRAALRSAMPRVGALAVMILSAGCGARAPDQADVNRTAGSTESAAGIAEAEPSYSMLFRFEEQSISTDWSVTGKTYSARVDDAKAASGSGSLRLTGDGSDGIPGGVFVRVPAERVRGSHIRLAAQVRTAGVADRAGAAIAISGRENVLALNDMGERALVGDTEWTKCDLVSFVPPDAEVILVGAYVRGAGTVWLDDFSVEQIELASGAIAGEVVDSHGAGHSDAFVAAFAEGAFLPTASAYARDGAFRFELPIGRYSLSATSGAAGFKYLKGIVVEEGRDSAARIQLEDDGKRAGGRIVAPHGAPVSTGVVRVMSDENTFPKQVFIAPVGSGAYAMILPDGDWEFELISPTHRSIRYWMGNRRGDELDLIAYERSPLYSVPASDTVAWVAKRALPIARSEPGSDWADLGPLREFIADARVVGLGEGTHGTREFFQFKHRLFEYLVAELGFSVFAFEANFSESLVVNEYVQTGVGDPRKAIAGMGFEIWETEEVLALVEWMRAHNANPKHARKVSFYGLDMQFSRHGVEAVHEYLVRVDPKLARRVHDELAPLREDGAMWGYGSLAPEKQSAARAALDEVSDALRRKRKQYIAKTSPHEWALVQQRVVAAKQSEAMYRLPIVEMVAFRDRAMADNVEWVLNHEGPSAKVAIWAHNLHVAYGNWSGTIPSLGGLLRARMGDAYRSLGFLFSRGSFRALGYLFGMSFSRGFATFELGAAPAHTIEGLLDRAGHPMLILDLRAADVPEYLRAPRLYRSTVTATYFGEARSEEPIVITDQYDGIVFFRETTASIPFESADASEPENE